MSSNMLWVEKSKLYFTKCFELEKQFEKVLFEMFEIFLFNVTYGYDDDDDWFFGVATNR